MLKLREPSLLYFSDFFVVAFGHISGINIIF